MAIGGEFWLKITVALNAEQSAATREIGCLVDGEVLLQETRPLLGPCTYSGQVFS